MINKFKVLQLQTMDQHLAALRFSERPSDGWISAVRKSLGMNVSQLAKRLKITKQSAAKLETNEIEDAITLKSLRRVAEAMDCQLVYALVPHGGSLESLIQKQALKKAQEIVEPVDHSMMLEGQNIGNLQEEIKRTAKDLAKNPNSKLWD
jgi:predicted DNA-binding mobile mystery protein A